MNDRWRILTCVFGCLLIGCNQSNHPTGQSVANSLTTWERPRFELGGGNAMVFCVLYGEFPTNLTVSASAYRTMGLPEGVELRKLSRAQRPVFPFTDGDFAKTAGAENPGLFAKLQTVPECLILQGQVADPKDLNYLRDAIGLATWFLDHGGVAIMDVQQLRLFERFIDLQAEGGRIPEGQEIRMKALPAGMTCHHAGTLDDLDFNNVHVEIRWQGGSR